MRRAHTGYPTPTADSYNYANSSNGGDSLVEAENDRLTDELKGKVNTLKSVSIVIGNELRSQNKFLSEMDDDMDGAGGWLGKASRRVKGLAKGSHNHITLYLILFALFVFFCIWLLMKF